MSHIPRATRKLPFRASVVSIAVAGALAAMYYPAHANSGNGVTPQHVRGVVAGAVLSTTNGIGTPVPAVYPFARVCADTNNNAVCDAGEDSTSADALGYFDLESNKGGPILAEVTSATTVGGQVVAQRATFRAPLAQLAANTANAGHSAVQTPINAVVGVTPFSTEIMRMMESDGIDYATARSNVATHIGVPVDAALSDGQSLLAGAPDALLREAAILGNRFALATTMFERHDVSPAAAALDPNAVSPISMKEAQQVAMSLEGIPRYDHLFIIMLENKATSAIRNSPFAPKINAYLNANAAFTSYFATGNPSEPNRLAVAAADDFGITDDNAVNCIPAGDTADAMEEQLPAGMAPCVQATNHNIKGKPNLMNALAAAGMSWRVYSESMNPNRDPLLDGAADPTVTALDHVYTASDPTGVIGTPGLVLPFPAAAYRPKHNESVNFQNVRNLPDYHANNRSMGGGQWDDAIKAAYPGWEVDQFGKDLASGNVAQVNYLEPDQCDDMHGITVQGTNAAGQKVNASDCGGSAIIYRGDNYTDALIKKIQSSPLWTNRQKRVAIVIMFDEGSATTGFNSCCGWNPSAGSSIAGKTLGPLVLNSGGTVANDGSIANYNQGNKGHGTSIFGLLTNQPGPKAVVDSDAYSHISFVRTMQDMFGVADPGDDWSYMNRSKYTQRFIAANLAHLPEYAASADTHFDAVRPMNHAYVIPAGYVQKSGFLTPPGPQVGPDATQLNPWSVK
ncbi:MAG TPA: alkaline phosphatase family protein [Usitatibacter sp.]|nr:alkaline phosphatase family protein [Usitatibacter sp.]